jgi:hypothetical protein
MFEDGVNGAGNGRLDHSMTMERIQIRQLFARVGLGSVTEGMMNTRGIRDGESVQFAAALTERVREILRV